MNLSFLKSKKIDQIIWLGAGDLSKEELVFNNKAAVHLIDADETVIERLHKRFKDQKNVTIHSLLISNNNNNADFIHYSLNEFNGIAKPAALKERYPGLKQLQSESKQAKAVSEFLTNIDLKPEKNNTAIFDLPGLSSTLIQTLINDNALHQFKHLVVLTNNEKLFEDELIASDLIDLLETNGFLCQMHQSKYQDYVIIQAQLNPVYKELTESKKQVINAQVDFKRIQDLLSKSQNELENSRLENHKISDQLTNLQQQLEQFNVKQESEKKQTNLQKEVQQTQMAEVVQQKEALANKLEQKQAEYQIQLAQLQNDKVQLQAKETELIATLAAERNNKDKEKASNIQLSNVNEQFKMELVVVKKEITELHEKLQVSEQALEEKNKVLTLQQQETEQTKKRQLLLENELLKTELQIDIIKDLLIKETSKK